MFTLLNYIYQLLSGSQDLTGQILSFFFNTLNLIWSGLSFVLTFVSGCPSFLAGFVGFGVLLCFGNIILKVI